MPPISAEIHAPSDSIPLTEMWWRGTLGRVAGGVCAKDVSSAESTKIITAACVVGVRMSVSWQWSNGMTSVQTDQNGAQLTQGGTQRVRGKDVMKMRNSRTCNHNMCASMPAESHKSHVANDQLDLRLPTLAEAVSDQTFTSQWCARVWPHEKESEPAGTSREENDLLGSHLCRCKNYRRVARRRTHLWTGGRTCWAYVNLNVNFDLRACPSW